MNPPPLWKHQAKAVEVAKTLDDLAVFFDLGTGKSRTLVEILRTRFNRHNRYLKTLIVAPSSVVPQWKKQILLYSQILEDKIHVLDDKKSLKERAHIYRTKGAGIYIINFEAFAFPQWAEEVLEDVPEILIIDESHRLKSFDAKRTKAIAKVSLKMEKMEVKHRYILTGSPVLNSQLDIFTQFLILDGGKTFGTNYYAFRSTYFSSVTRKINAQKSFNEWHPKPGIDELLKEKMAAKTVLAKKQDCIDLPPQLYVTIDVELGKDQKKAYDEMKRHMITFVNELGENPDAVMAELAITKMLRLLQITSGFAKTDNDNIHRFKDNPRAAALSDLLEDITPKEKVVVWCVFHEDFDIALDVCKKLDIKCAEFTGRNKSTRAEALQSFVDDESVRVMVASPQAGGTGVDEMKIASVCVYYSRTANLEHNEQSEARTYRGGSNIHEKVTRYDIVAPGYDTEVLKLLKAKKQLSTNILALRDLLSKI